VPLGLSRLRSAVACRPRGGLRLAHRTTTRLCTAERSPCVSPSVSLSLLPPDCVALPERRRHRRRCARTSHSPRRAVPAPCPSPVRCCWSAAAWSASR
jgi:hypothetical protein